jgi:DNA polymerase-3 subunit delta'
VHPDIHLLIPSGASHQIKIDDVRGLISRIALRPFGAKVQVAIIDGAERLTEEAANSLLKSLEEPSDHTRFFLTTTHLDGCLSTVVSRCQLIRCQPLSLQALKQILVKWQGCDSRIAEVIARLCGGSASKAIELHSRWATHQRLLSRLATETQASLLEQPLPESRDEVISLLEAMVEWLRDLAMAAVSCPAYAANQGYEDALRRQAQTIDVDRCVETAFEIMELRESVDQFVSPRLIAALMREKWLSLNTRSE